MKVVGLEPTTYGLKVRGKPRQNKGLASSVAQKVATDTAENGCERLISLAETDPELARLVSAWPKLSAVVKRMILAALEADQGAGGVMPFADPEKRRQYDAEHKRRMRVAEPCPTRLTLPVEFRAKTAADVLTLLNEQIETVRKDGSLGSVERAKAVGALAGIALRASDAGDVTARVEALESILNSRPKERDAA